ncbi:hypothetical protein BsWGS_05741 [Bradybaena similaris]
MALKKQIIYMLAVASLTVSGMAQKQACEALDDGPFLATLPTLNLMVPEATDTDLQAAETSGSKKYFSELRISGNPSTDFNLTAVGNIVDPFEYFTVVTDAGLNYFKLIKAIDRDGFTSSPEDDIDFIPFTLTCQPTNSSLPQLVYDGRVFITDVNDNIPVFPKGNSALNFTFSEATPIGTVLFTAEADDKDAHLDSNITYTLHNYNNLFSVDNLTGAVTLTSELDYESLPSDKAIALILTAQDTELGVMNTVTATATVHVTDADDQGPAFTYPGCFTYKSVCAWPKYTTGRSLKKDQAIQVQPVPNKGQGPVAINAADLDVAMGNKITFSIASTIPPGSESKFRVDTVQVAGKNEYTASVVPLSDFTVNEGFEIFLTATEQSVTMKHEIAMILFTEPSGPVDTSGQGSNNNTSGDDDAGYSKLEVGLIVVVAILAAFLLCACITMIILWRRAGLRKPKSEYTMGTTNNGFTERL